MKSLLTIAALTSFAAGDPLAAQSRSVTVSGVAFDSLRNKPLVGAFVVVMGVSRSATTDTAGRFRIDSVPPGTLTFALQHAALDSLGLTGLTLRTVVTDSMRDVRLAIPSFSTFWRQACGDSPVPIDAGLVYGMIRDATTRKPVADAAIELAWIDLAASQKPGVRQTVWRDEAYSDSTGTYGVCGVPVENPFQLRAFKDTRSSGQIDLLKGGPRVQRQDLLIGARLAAKDSAQRGTIVATILDGNGKPFAGARVLLEGTPESRTNPDGRAVIRGVIPGTRQVTVTSVGMTPMPVTVDVFPGDTALFTAQLRRVTVLATTDVRAATTAKKALIAAFEARRKLGLGHVVDSTQLIDKSSLMGVFTNMNGVQITRGLGSAFVVSLGRGSRVCTAPVWIDGVRQVDQADLPNIHPDELAAIEVYQGVDLPLEFTGTGRNPCGAIVLWTKEHFR